MIRLLILSAIALGLTFPISGQTTTTLTPEEANRVKAWRTSHPQFEPIAKAQLSRLSEYTKLRLYGNENSLFYEGTLTMADIEAFLAGTRPDFIQHLAAPYEKWRVTQWIDEHEDEIPIWSRADFNALSPDEQAKLQAENAFIYQGDFPTLAEIRAYEED